MTVSIEEGQVFEVPLNGDICAVGVAARLQRQKRGKVVGLFAYFFGPFDTKSAEAQIEWLDANNAVMRLRCSALFIHDKRWKVIGKLGNYTRARWPLPVFFRDDLLQGTVLVYYDDELNLVNEEPYPGGDQKLADRQMVSGAEAVEIVLRQAFGINKTEPEEI
jgi:hypothetical protein